MAYLLHACHRSLSWSRLSKSEIGTMSLSCSSYLYVSRNQPWHLCLCHYVLTCQSSWTLGWTQPLAQITSQSPYYLPKRTWSPTRGPAEGRRKLRKIFQAKNKAASCIVALRCCGFWDFVSVCHWLFLKSWILNRRHWGWRQLESVGGC